MFHMSKLFQSVQFVHEFKFNLRCLFFEIYCGLANDSLPFKAFIILGCSPARLSKF